MHRSEAGRIFTSDLEGRMAAEQREARSGRGERPIAVLGALAANVLIAVAKFVVAGIVGSAALLAEAIHSVVDTGNELLMLVGVYRSRRPADEAHPYGYGKELYFWTLIVAVVLFGIGGGMSIVDGVEKLLRHEQGGRPLWGYVVLAIAAVFESASLALGIHQLKPGKRGLVEAVRRSKDPSRFLVVVEDSAALLGLTLAAAGLVVRQVTGWQWADAAASVAIGLVLCAAAIFLVLQSHSLLIGETAVREVREDIRRIAAADPAVRWAAKPLTMQLGPEEMLVNLRLSFVEGLDGEALAETIDRLQERIRRAHADVRWVFVEAESLKEARREGGRPRPPSRGAEDLRRPLQ